jgi:hypothetical protein
MAKASSAQPVPPPEETDRSDVYRLAYDLGLRTLDDQRDELNGIRTRAGAYMAFVGSATGFLVGTTLRGASAESGTWFFPVAAAGTATFIIALIYMARLLSPGLEFDFRQSPEIIITDYIETQIPQLPSKTQVLRDLSLEWNASIIENEGNLKPLRKRYRAVIIWGGASLVFWTSAIWMFGRVGA